MDDKFAVIGGSGGYDILRDGNFGDDLDCKKVLTPFGESAPVHRFSKNGISFLFLSRHGEERYSASAPFVNYRANIWALKECGVNRIFSWSGPGIINKELSTGDFVLPHDLIDETKNRDYTFFETKGIGFIRQKSPFCEEIRKVLRSTIQQLNLKLHEKGVYVCTQGPRLETPAEINKYKISGGDMVGMTLVPEAFLARELEMCYAPACYLTNYAEGVLDRSIETGELFEGMVNNEEKTKIDESVKQFPAIIQKLVMTMQSVKRSCHCKDAMLRYKKEGVISEDWRTWIK
jgi:5'-methylthioadenosine phosphorylase